MSPEPDKKASTSRRARSFRPSDSQVEFEADFFGDVLERRPNDVDLLRRQAELLAQLNRHRAALNYDRRLVALQPSDPVSHYNLACTLAVLGQADEAIEALAVSLSLGYDDFAHLESDADLDDLRDHPAFVGLLRKHGLWD